MRIFLILLLLTLQNAWAMKVMTFNTMCDFCKGSSFFNYDERATQIRKILEREKLDLIALQEVRSYSQVEFIGANLKNYHVVSNNKGFISYADPTLLIHKSFKIIESGQFWLGPNKDKINFGWKFAVPRQVIWAKIKKNEKEFIFASTHFDNRLENLLGASKLVHNFFKLKGVPFILAGDTNLTTDMPEYTILTKNLFKNAYNIIGQHHIIGNQLDNKDLCYLKKGKVFPACRVDHVLISNNFPLKPIYFQIDLTRFNDQFPSDHRPVIVTFEALEQLPSSKK